MPKQRRKLVEDAGILKTVGVMMFCHFSVMLLCINVMFDLVAYGLPLLILRKFGIISSKMFYRWTSCVINWTTPIVYGIPMVFSGTRIFCNDMEIVINLKSENSLLLSNHGSRVDWMVAMFVGHLKSIGNKVTEQSRVGFVCEAAIQFMPLIGWYRKFVCCDIFVWRSFQNDATPIRKNITRFHDASQKRMLFLSPEGVVVDFDEKDEIYIKECRAFCKKQGYAPYDYVLTPRYKGTTCLLKQVTNSEYITSICLAFVKDGKLLNCKLLSSERVVPDIYNLIQGIWGKPVNIYMYLRKVSVSLHSFDAKTVLMKEYAWKESVLAECDNQLRRGSMETILFKKFHQLEGNVKDVIINQIIHSILILFAAIYFSCLVHVIFFSCGLFIVISLVHTFGWFVSSTSMESVPFETGVKAFITFITKFKERISKQI